MIIIIVIIIIIVFNTLLEKHIKRFVEVHTNALWKKKIQNQFMLGKQGPDFRAEFILVWIEIYTHETKRNDKTKCIHIQQLYLMFLYVSFNTSMIVRQRRTTGAREGAKTSQISAFDNWIHLKVH